MKRIKILYGDSVAQLQKTIDNWTEETSPDIISVSLAIDNNGNRYLAVVYIQPIQNLTNVGVKI